MKVELLETKVAEQAFLLKECKMSSDKKYEKKCHWIIIEKK
jgi:hypothetical protein